MKKILPARQHGTKVAHLPLSCLGLIRDQTIKCLNDALRAGRYIETWAVRWDVKPGTKSACIVCWWMLKIPPMASFVKKR